jgi:histidinol dehydrogenase
LLCAIKLNYNCFKMLKLIPPSAIPLRNSQAYDSDTLSKVETMFTEIRKGGVDTIRSYAEQFGEISTGQDLLATPKEMENAVNALSQNELGVLKRVADRIKTFAEAQKSCLTPLSVKILGGEVGHEVLPVDTAGCYAPGGRFPLPSSVLMTVIPAKVAGVKTVILASPKPTPHTLAAAYIAGADYIVRIGGVQAVAGMAYGMFGCPSADIIVGPGNRWVTSAKQLLSAHVGIDMLAGPSELMVIADETADSETISLDLLAQAEHDPDAIPILLSTSRTLIEEVNVALKKNLAKLREPNRAIAKESLNNGFAVCVNDIAESTQIANLYAPEHLELFFDNADKFASNFTNCGGLFIGGLAAEVVGDYGAGPNHTLPTGGSAKFKGGLSVFNFLRLRTWMNIENQAAAEQLYRDAAALGRIEGLEAHARSAEARLKLRDRDVK